MQQTITFPESNTIPSCEQDYQHIAVGEIDYSNEIWKDIPGFEGKYQISTLARVRSLGYKYELKNTIKESITKILKISEKDGCVKLGGCNNRADISVGRLMYLTFVNPNLTSDIGVYRIKHKNPPTLDNLQLIQRENKEIRLNNIRYGNILVIVKNPQTKRWICKCDCGNTVELSTQSLRNGKLQYCGYLCKLNTKNRLKSKAEKLFSSYKRGAKSRKIEFFLSSEQFLSLIKQDCFYCGTKPKKLRYYSKYDNVSYNGVDRLDSDKGYMYDNCVPCCKYCNISKLDTPPLDWLNWIYKISYRKDKIKKFFLEKFNADK